MGKECNRLAECEVRSIADPDAPPVKLCRACLIMIGPNGERVDIFRWLTNNQIEATS